MTLPRVAQSPQDPGFVQDPYPFYDHIRQTGAWVFWEDYDLPCATTLPLVNALLRDRRLGRENPFPDAVPAHLEPFYQIERYSMLELEPPTHTRLRGLVMRAFTSRKIAGLGPQITALAHELLDEMPAGEVDLLPTFCERIPVIVICRLLGVPEDAAPQLLSWSHDMVAMYQARRDRAVEERAVAASIAFDRYLRELIEERRADPREDLLSDLIKVEEDGDRLSTAELVSTMILLLNAGHEATVHALGNGIKAICERGLGPEVPKMDAPVLADEVMRFDPPLHLFTRYAMEDVELEGMSLQKGEQVGLLLGAANRDPDVFPSPHSFIPDRLAGAHVALGAGLHFCVGAPLARLEIARSLPVLFSRFPNLTPSEPLKFADRYHFHGLERLPVKLKPL
ncbi:MAG: cytochrome P450 [Pseudomonadota bacterium]